MSMDSDNSDPKKCTASKLGRVHSARQNPGRSHAVRYCACYCVHNKLVVRACAPCRAHATFATHATIMTKNPGCVLKRPPMSRHQIHVVTSNFPNRCRDTKFLPIVLRHQNCVATLLKPLFVATQSIPASPFLGHDLKTMLRLASTSPTETPLSRPKILVATPNHHRAARTKLRHQIGVATPLRPI